VIKVRKIANKTKSQKQRDGLTGEHAVGDAGQIVLA
jgi:hypothetical protein